MNESKGKFICPKCNNNNGIASTNGEYSKGNYKKWIYKSENNNGILEKKWFFYNKEEYWYCCSLCEGPEDCCSDYLTCNFGDCKDCKDECKESCCSRECLGLTFTGIFFFVCFPPGMGTRSGSGSIRAASSSSAVSGAASSPERPGRRKFSHSAMRSDRDFPSFDVWVLSG